MIIEKIALFFLSKMSIIFGESRSIEYPMQYITSKTCLEASKVSAVKHDGVTKGFTESVVSVDMGIYDQLDVVIEPSRSTLVGQNSILTKFRKLFVYEWVDGTSSSVNQLGLGPVSAVLTKRYHHKTLICFGGLFTGGGLILSSIAPSIEVLYLTYGIITGIGFEMSFPPSVMMIAVYFDKNRSIASGILFARGGLGGMLFPYLLRYLLREYGLKGTFIVYGGIILNICVCGLLVRPLPDFGGQKSFGILYVELSEKFQASNRALSVTQSLAGFLQQFLVYALGYVIFTGAIRDSTGTWTPAFQLSGAMTLTAVLILVFKCLKDRKRSNKE
ncbi:monocarboxylate transporter 1-like [Pecten maximus]|uniref:monocarboxylate transporter 1-like n=1 Tax=Pecten maximus TaxID=6579 RepID=UPI001458D1FC|nr:monocarboxylate transporter 1-like [Pecten maximus]